MNVICYALNTGIANYIGVKYLKADTVTIVSTMDARQVKSAKMLAHYFQKNQIEHINLLRSSKLSDSVQMGHDDACYIIPKIETLDTFELYHALLRSNHRCIFVEPEGQILELKNERLIEASTDDVDLTVKDFIAQSNGVIIDTSNELFNQPAANELLNYILKYLKAFDEISKFIRPMKSRERQSKNAPPSPYSDVDLTKLNAEQQRLYIDALNLLANRGIIVLRKFDDEIEVYFNDLSYRDYFSKAGTWFEHFVLNSVKKIDGIDDAKSSVFFMWDTHAKLVKNEIDIMATYENQLIAISCKDTKSILDEYLYELETHSEKLSLEGTIKIIATTARPTEMIRERAEFLGIYIIPFEGQIDAFVDALSHVIVNVP